MASEFITNKDKKLSDVINNILPATDNLYFLVGYFYFSGFEKIYKQVIDKKLKILVGLQIEIDLTNRIKELYFLEKLNISRAKVRDNYLQSIVDVFNETDIFDTEEKQDAFRLFIDKIHDGTMEIRKTQESNHAKLYIFENKTEQNHGGEFLGTVITGSSNLTHSGLEGRFEINVSLRDNYNFTLAQNLFLELWEKSVVIVDENNKNDFLNKVVEKIWLDKLPKPFLLYIRVLAEYFAEQEELITLPADITDGKYFNFKYQVDAIKRAIGIIERHNGVIVADVVGLGKSIIASTVAHNLNLKTIVIAPPHLEQQWNDYRYEFSFNAKVYSSGKIKTALEENLDDEQKLIIIDEAHKYRNELNADYAYLHQLCQQNKVMLLTATPFNNRPQDIFSMIKLFQIPTRSTIRTIENLSYQFYSLILRYKEIKKIQRSKTESQQEIEKRINEVANEIRDILSPLIVRRSRLDLEAIEEYKEDLVQQNISFPVVNDPIELEYNLDDIEELYANTLHKICPQNEDEGFIGARYMPVNYVKNFDKYKKNIAKDMGIDENLLKQSQVNLAKFMRRLLVRRFESSMESFRLSLRSMIKSSETIESWYEKKGGVPVFKKGDLPGPEDLLNLTGDDALKTLDELLEDEKLDKYVQRGLWFIEKKELKVGFILQVKKDIQLLKEIYNDWFGNRIISDPKLSHFTELIKSQLRSDPTRKIVVFTEFADTANYLYESLKDGLRIFKYSSSDNTKENKQTIRSNFDAGYDKPENDFDILIATDAISEGYNLHRAGTIFNYDIPYNPTRVIQRVGRINRINKKVFDELFIYNFFPSATGEKETHIKEIATLKMDMIHALLGEDTMVLTDQEKLGSRFAVQFKEQIGKQEQLSPEAKYENLIKNYRAYNQDIINEALAVPKRVKIKRSFKKDEDGVLLFARKGKEYVFKLTKPEGESTNLTSAKGLELFEAELQEDPHEVSKVFDKVYQIAKSNLFITKTVMTKDKGKKDAIAKLKLLKKDFSQYRDYLEDLVYVAEKLDALPERYLKMIRAISIDTIEQDMNSFIDEVSTTYLSKIIDREQAIANEKESLIIAEELI